MRDQFIKTTADLMKEDPRVALLLGDISVWGFRDVLQRYPDRAFNLGILEQSMVGVAAGMAMSGMLPIVHTIAPFIVERAYEQLKIDFGYQGVCGNFVSVGASYDYSTMGCTHHCPADVSLLAQIPNMEIIVPGAPREFDKLFTLRYKGRHPTYYSLSKFCNTRAFDVRFAKLTPVSGNRQESLFTVLAIGPAFSWLEKFGFLSAYQNSIRLLYSATVRPLDLSVLLEECPSKSLLLVEPYYPGYLLQQVNKLFPEMYIECVGIPQRFLSEYSVDFYTSDVALEIRQNLLEAGKRLWDHHWK